MSMIMPSFDAFLVLIVPFMELKRIIGAATGVAGAVLIVPFMELKL